MGIDQFERTNTPVNYIIAMTVIRVQKAIQRANVLYSNVLLLDSEVRIALYL